MSYLTQSDQQLQEELAAYLSFGAASLPSNLISDFSLCFVPCLSCNFCLVPLGLIFSQRYSVLENNATIYPHPQMLCYKLYLLLFVSGMGWAMINPDKYCCFYCLITSAKGSFQEYEQPEARCPAGHLERISCHHGCTVSLVHEHLCQLRFNFMPVQAFPAYVYQMYLWTS